MKYDWRGHQLHIILNKRDFTAINVLAVRPWKPGVSQVHFTYGTDGETRFDIGYCAEEDLPQNL